MVLWRLIAVLVVSVLMVIPVQAEEEKKPLILFDGQKSILVPSGDEDVEIARHKTPEALIGGVLQPIIPVKGVHPVGEVEVLKALQDDSFKVVDMRTLTWRLKSTIPGSIHIPYTKVDQRLDELGCIKSGEKWDCSKAVRVVGFCNGANCPQSPIAIRAMVRAGYPVDRIYYYRGGMQSWLVMGLTVVEDGF